MIKVRAYQENQDQKGTKVHKDDLVIREFVEMLDLQGQKALWAILERQDTLEIRDHKDSKETEVMMEMKGLLEFMVIVVWKCYNVRWNILQQHTMNILNLDNDVIYVLSKKIFVHYRNFFGFN